MTIEQHTIKATTTGSAGSASGTGTKAVPVSELVGLYIDYHASAPATTDVTIKSKAPSGGTPPDVTMATISNTATDAWYYPKEQKDDNAGAAITGDYQDPIVHGGIIEVSVAQADALTDCVTVYLYLRV